MSERKLARRRFLSLASAGAAALGANALSRSRVYGANEKISIASVGVGGRGSALMRQISQLGGLIRVHI